MSHKININLNSKKTFYPITIKEGLLSSISWIPKQYKKIAIITDNSVKKRYAMKLIHLLHEQSYEVILLSFAAGEQSKDIHTFTKIINTMLAHQYSKDTLILALGGGVVGDISGFVSATYMRGLPYIQIPTTLLAMVDSSVGGKTAIDLKHGKNLIGAFWQPTSVIIDPHCLSTLPKKHLINGLIEALKMFLTHSKKHVFYLQKNLDHILKLNKRKLHNIIYQALIIKSSVVMQDEKDKHARMILNFGHTIGHALEKVSQYKILHGHAVAFGILVEAKISELLKILSKEDFLVIQTIIESLGFNRKKLKKFNITEIIKASKIDKKAHAGQVNYVLLKSIGAVYIHNNHYVHPVLDHIVEKAFNAINEV